ncbi:MAG: hypothetical protein Ct9H300mP1_36460 [Planctomycetaceae bacterium]|nr:MAG: hypothetical protein Ct9H300mP1_36460 [Planctomycetaceae bacterium]
MTNSDRTPQETTHRVDSKHDVSASRGRKKVERRRHIDPTTCERDYDHQEIEFMTAMDDYKRRSGRQFPTWSEVLEVMRSLATARLQLQAKSRSRPRHLARRS